MHPRDVEKTAFVVPFGSFEYVPLPFGLSNAHATFQRMMQRCLRDLCYMEVLIYLDDIIVFSPDFDSHIEPLDRVFTRLNEFGLKLRPVKCHLMRQEVQYLGHRVSASAIAVDPDKVSAVQGWKEPKTVKDVHAFLGFNGFFRRFVQGYATIAAPLYRYLKAGVGQRKKGKKGPDWVFSWGRSALLSRSSSATVPEQGEAWLHRTAVGSTTELI